MKKQGFKFTKRLVAILVLAVITVYLFTAISIYSYGKKNEPCEGVAALVLGAAVWTNEPSPVFRERINHAVDLYKSGKVKKIIFTGRKSAEDNISEAESAKVYAINAGVNTDDILLEDQSWTTYSNLVNAKKIINGNNLANVIIVSDPLHLKRASMMATELGIPACTSKTPTTKYQTLRTQLPFLLRETYFYLEHFIIKA